MGLFFYHCSNFPILTSEPLDMAYRIFQTPKEAFDPFHMNLATSTTCFEQYEEMLNITVPEEKSTLNDFHI